MPGDDALSLLIVDDSKFFTSLLSDKLESAYDMRTTTAPTAADGMDALERESIDCVVSDYQMPGSSGLDLFEMVRESYDLPFILLTAEGDEEIASRAIRLGIDDYLLKQSVKEEEALELLVNRIRNVVDQRRTERKYEQLIANSPDEISQLAVDGTILAANDAMATAFSVDRDELVGHHLSNFLPEDVAADRLAEGKRAITAGSAVTFQDTVGVRHFHNIAVPLSTPGEEESIQLVTREITLQKRTEQELEQKSEKLALINRIVRHDINNDVQLLIAWADSLSGHVDEAGEEFVGRIAETGTHIAELTSIARDFVESFEDGSGVDLEPVHVDRVLAAEVEKRQTSFEDARIELADPSSTTVLANELLSSVFGNLLTNAIRHNDAETPKVRVSVEEMETAVRVCVADNGPGVPDDRKDAIFGKGEMGPESPGTGVGLYLVHTLVDRYGGDVWVEDNDPAGAVFVVELPKAPDRTATGV